MKKQMILILLCAAMLLTLCACGAANDVVDTPAAEQTEQTDEQPSDSSTQDSGATLANPMTEYASLEELNAAAGTELRRPGVMGLTDERFESIACDNYLIAQYTFSAGGTEYVLRSAPVTDDISGYYIGGNTAFPGEPKEGLDFALGEGQAQLVRWFNIDGQFCLMAEQAPENFSDIAAEISGIGMQNGKDLVGEYNDSFSQRASMTVEALYGSNSYRVTVFWGSTATESTIWTMTAHMDADGLLSYTDGTCENHSVEADGSEKMETVAENESGFFTPKEGKLLWNGAPDESCVDCVFEKAE